MDHLETKFLSYIQKIAHFNEAVGLMGWDLRTGAPAKGVSQRSEVIGTLSTEVFKMSTATELEEMIAELKKESNWSSIGKVSKSSVLECEKNMKKIKNIPEKEFKDYVVLTSTAESVWEKAKEEDDFETFKPYLEKIVEFNRKYVEWVGYEGNKYNALLDDYEPGVTVDQIDEIFGRLKEAIVPLLQKVTAATNQPETDFLFKPFPKEKQRALSLEILDAMQYDFNAGRLDTAVHPFAIGLSPGDVRVTTKYDENDFRTAVFGTIHEGGHALYEQNIDEKFIGTPLCTGTSMGIHESQSLFWENFVGRNRSFWKKYYPTLKNHASGQFDHVNEEDFYRGINVAKASLIRIEADEMTYCLHIIVRYELEKALINGELEVADLPEAWNNKMEELLGIRPSTNQEGVLQDVHWGGGMFGYFPSYALGYVYAAQLKSAILKELPQFDELLEQGDLAPIKKWMTHNIHRFGKSKQPVELIQNATGEELNPEHLIHYLEDKYTSVYDL